MKNIRTLLILLLATTLAHAQDDALVFKDGKRETGTVENFQADKNIVNFKSAMGTIPYPMAEIKTIKMAERKELTRAKQELKNNQFKEAIKLLEPIFNSYLGLDVPWVAEAAGLMGEAYIGMKEETKAQEIYNAIAKAYPNSPYRLKGQFAKAKTFISRDVSTALEEGLKILDTIESEVPKSSIPPPSDMQILSEIYFLRGQAYEKLNKSPQALEAYLKVATLYYQPESRALEAQQRADALREKDKTAVVP